MANTYEANNVPHFFSTNAGFQTWVQAIEASLLASGFLEVAPDTGQITPATVVKPGVSAYAGFRIYRAKDVLQATKPIFLKVEYGIGAGGSDPVERYSIGTGTDGAGTLTGVGYSAILPAASGSTGAGTTSSIFGGGGPAAAFVYARIDGGSPPSLEYVFSLGRFVDPSTGLANNLGMFYYAANGGSAQPSISFSDFTSLFNAQFATMFPNLNAAPNSAGTPTKTRAVKGQVIRLGEHSELPFIVGIKGEFPTTQLAANMKFTSAAWGALRTWLPVKPSFDGTSGTLTVSIPIFRWD